VGGHGGDSGGGAPDRLHHGALSLPEHVHIAGKSWFPLSVTLCMLHRLQKTHRCAQKKQFQLKSECPKRNSVIIVMSEKTLRAAFHNKNITGILLHEAFGGVNHL